MADFPKPTPRTRSSHGRVSSSQASHTTFTSTNLITMTRFYQRWIHKTLNSMRSRISFHILSHGSTFRVPRILLRLLPMLRFGIFVFIYFDCSIIVYFLYLESFYIYTLYILMLFYLSLWSLMCFLVHIFIYFAIFVTKRESSFHNWQASWFT